MELRFFGQGKSLVRMLTLFILAPAIAMVGMAQTVSPAYANGAGGAASGYVSNAPLTAQQQRQLDAKNAAVAQWDASGSAYTLSAIKHGVSKTQSSAVTPDCITDPYTGGCANWYVVSVGGQFTQEPIQEPDWCGPGAETAVAMHWISSTVANFGSVWVQSQRSSDYGASVQLTGAQGWMGNMAYYYHFYSNRSGSYINGIEPFSSKAAWDTDMRDSMNSAFAGGYYVIKGSSVIKQESDLYGNATYDLSHDGHPMIFLVNASQLPEWPRSSTVINHYIEGYSYAFWTDHNTNATNKIYYADTASADDSGTAGDYGMTYDDFWNGPWKTGSQVIIV